MGAGPPPFAAIVLEGRFRTPAGLTLTVKSFPPCFGALRFVTVGVFPAPAGGSRRRRGRRRPTARIGDGAGRGRWR